MHKFNEKILEIIKKTMININVTPRGYRDGLYGNALQIMGMGGLLIRVKSRYYKACNVYFVSFGEY